MPHMSGGDAVDSRVGNTNPTCVEVTKLAKRLEIPIEKVREKIQSNDWGLGEAQTVVKYCREQGFDISFERLSEAGLKER